MRPTIALAGVVVLLTAAPAFARGHTPQTEFSGPGSVGSIQEQDMQRSQAKTDNQKAQAPNSGTVQPSASLDPQQNPHYFHTPH